MTDTRAPWWDAVGSGESLTLKVERRAQPPLPWTWEVVGEGGGAAARRSLRGYRAAEDAWAAGRVALADLQRGGRLDAPTAEQRAEIAEKAAAKRKSPSQE
jgi:hypothetical protein